jgi:hypothetical protein
MCSKGSEPADIRKESSRRSKFSRKLLGALEQVSCVLDSNSCSLVHGVVFVRPHTEARSSSCETVGWEGPQTRNSSDDRMLSFANFLIPLAAVIGWSWLFVISVICSLAAETRTLLVEYITKLQKTLNRLEALLRRQQHPLCDGPGVNKNGSPHTQFITRCSSGVFLLELLGKRKCSSTSSLR